jgi:hypothetical protein
MFKEPQERLARASQFRNLIECQLDRLLHPPVRIFLQAVANLYKANGGDDDQFASPRLFVARRQGALPQ